MNTHIADNLTDTQPNYTITLVHATIVNNVAEVLVGRSWSVWGESFPLAHPGR